MSFPLPQGSTPFSGIIPADQWTLICNEVSVAKIINMYVATQQVWLTYANISEDPPIDFDTPLKWRMKGDTAQFKNGAGQSNVYAYPVDKDAEIGVEA